MNKYRVVFHLAGPSKGRADQVFRNIENLLDDLGVNNVEVELVANGGGVKTLLVNGPYSRAEQVGPLASRGVLFAVCAHSFSQLKIARDALLGSARVVSSGVGELVKKQVGDGHIFGLNKDPLASRPVWRGACIATA